MRCGLCFYLMLHCCKMLYWFLFWLSAYKFVSQALRFMIQMRICKWTLILQMVKCSLHQSDGPSDSLHVHTFKHACLSKTSCLAGFVAILPLRRQAMDAVQRTIHERRYSSGQREALLMRHALPCPCSILCCATGAPQLFMHVWPTVMRKPAEWWCLRSCIKSGCFAVQCFELHADGSNHNCSTSQL